MLEGCCRAFHRYHGWWFGPRKRFAWPEDGTEHCVVFVELDLNVKDGGIRVVRSYKVNCD